MVRITQQMKKSAQDGTTVTLVPDDNGVGEVHPTDAKMTQLVGTFTATPTHILGAAAGSGHKVRVIIEVYT